MNPSDIKVDKDIPLPPMGRARIYPAINVGESVGFPSYLAAKNFAAALHARQMRMAVRKLDDEYRVWRVE